MFKMPLEETELTVGLDGEGGDASGPITTRRSRNVDEDRAEMVFNLWSENGRQDRFLVLESISHHLLHHSHKGEFNTLVLGEKVIESVSQPETLGPRRVEVGVGKDMDPWRDKRNEVLLVTVEWAVGNVKHGFGQDMSDNEVEAVVERSLLFDLLGKLGRALFALQVTKREMSAGFSIGDGGGLPEIGEESDTAIPAATEPRPTADEVSTSKRLSVFPPTQRLRFPVVIFISIQKEKKRVKRMRLP